MKKILILIILSIGIAIYQTYSMEQDDHERKISFEEQEYNRNSRISDEKTLKDITATWIVNNISHINFLDKTNQLTEESKELIFKKILEKYKLKLIHLFNKSPIFLKEYYGEMSSEFSPCGKFAFTQYDNKTATIWDLRDLNNITSVNIRGPNCIISVAFSPCGRFALTGYSLTGSNNDLKANIWDLRDLNNIKSIPLQGHTYEITLATFSPNGNFALTGSNDNTTMLWDLRDLMNNITSIPLQGHTYEITSATFSPDGNFALTAYTDRTARLWNFSNLNNIKSTVLQGHTNSVNSVSFSPCGRFALTGSYDNTAILWDLSDLNNINSISLQGHNRWISSLAFSPDGNFVLTGSDDKTARLWDLRNLNNITSIVFQGHNQRIHSVTFSPCGNFALTGSDDTARLWDLSNLNNIKSIVLHGHTQRTFYIVTPRGGKQSMTLTSQGIHSVTFSPCGKFALIGSLDARGSVSRENTLRFWILDPNLTFEQLLLLAVLFEYKSKKINCHNILQNDSYYNIFLTFSDQQREQIGKYFFNI